VIAARPAAAAPPPLGTTIVTKSFSGTSVPDPAWVASGTTCLTGVCAAPPVGSAQIQTCANSRNGPVPALGATPGYLQFTDASTFKGGAATNLLPDTTAASPARVAAVLGGLLILVGLTIACPLYQDSRRTS
jgi:hypothetical protein